ncbi:hypothetical protein ACFUN8_27150 [Streptomyces sp. NPDC057307]|uniref:hypothetical protein n=1 Tax=Streptomyces sp. NPDC057307 TaxID=3346096 RepID=UPI00362E4284
MKTCHREARASWRKPLDTRRVLQGWKPDERLEAECAAFEAPGHAPGVPAHEAVIRIPARMVPMLREACDVAERAGLQ